MRGLRQARAAKQSGPLTRIVRDSADDSKDYMLPHARAQELYRAGKLGFNREIHAYCHKGKGEAKFT